MKHFFLLADWKVDLIIKEKDILTINIIDQLLLTHIPYSALNSQCIISPFNLVFLKSIRQMKVKLSMPLMSQ